MFERFGEFDSAAEINETAVNLRKEGDTESMKVLAEENCNAALYSRQKKHFIFDSINTITAHSFR